MPNHVTNYIQFRNDRYQHLPADEFRHLLMTLQGDDPERSYGSVDFNVLIQMPDGYMDDDRWYDWSIRNWGTKWNAYDCSHDDGSQSVTFLTAWAAPHPVIKAISKRFPDMHILHRWADEDVGHNVGTVMYLCGERVDENIPVGGTTAAYDMSAFILDIDLADYGLELGDDGQYHETEV